ncbi:MAG: hypothetical protein IH897_14850 [Planctomycetes bacterium]|nr:hypothetical protein [Planctomycetota bacterium]
MLALKISRAKWQRKDYLAENEIRADAITSLRTSDDRLSWWRCADDEEDVAQVALALAVGPKINRIDKFDIFVLPESILAEAGLASESTEGETAVKDLRARHVDLVKLDVERLAKVARILDPRIRSGEKVVQFTKAQLITLVTTAIHDKRLDADDLNENLRNKLDKSTGGPGS